jgi:hypothetical protein
MGNKTIWHTNPINMALGYMITLLKSSNVNDNPSPNMIIPNANERNRVVIKLDSI